MKRVLVTGSSGFIGSNLFKRCREEGWDVTGVDDLSGGYTEFNRDSITLDIVHSTYVLKGDFDVIFHLAARPRVSYSVEHPVETNDTNVSKTLKLIDTMKDRCGRFIFASSSSVYGGADLSHGPTHESQEKRPRSPYALQKSIIEDYLRLYDELYGLESACLRFFNVFGRNQLGGSAYSTAVSAWLFAALRGEPLRSDGDGEQTRDMCHVDNVVEACILAAKHPGRHMHSRRYNVACGASTSNNEILKYVKKAYPNITVRHAPERPGDVKHTLADISRIQEELGYEPKVLIWDGIDDTIRWLESNRWVLDLPVKGT